MNFYPHHIKDFNNSTRHLTRVERSVYRDSIELYYDTETALTLEITKLQRRLLCVTDEEKEALTTILNDFYTLTDYGYFNERCYQEIEKYRANTSAKAKAGIASAAARKKKSDEKKQNLTRVEHPLKSVQQTSNQEPVTNNIKSKALSDKSNVNAISIEILDHLNKQAGRKFKPVKANLSMITARLKEFTREELIAVIDDRCKEWGADEKMVSYLRPETLFNATKCAGYVGSLGALTVANGGKPWFLVFSAIEAKGAELEIIKQKGEQPQDYKVRVLKAAGVTHEMVVKARQDYK